MHMLYTIFWLFLFLSAKMPTTSEKEKKEIVDMEGNETLQANIALKPLMPYMATAFYKILDDYYQKVTDIL